MMTAATTCADGWKRAQLSHFPLDVNLSGTLLLSTAEQEKVIANFFLGTEIILLDWKRNLWGNIRLTHLPMLFSSLHYVQPKTRKWCQKQRGYFRSAFVIIGCSKRWILHLFFPNSWSFTAQTGFKNEFHHVMEGSLHHLTSVSFQGDLKGSLYRCPLPLFSYQVSSVFLECALPVPKEQHSDVEEPSNESMRSHRFCSTTAAWKTLPLYPGWCAQAAAPFALHSLVTACEPCSSCSLLCCPRGGMKGEGAYQNQIPYKTGKFSPTWGQLWWVTHYTKKVTLHYKLVSV